VQKILREHGPRFVMDYRCIADDEQDDAMPTHPIPDIAAEAAQSGGHAPSRESGARPAKLDAKALSVLIEELAACNRVLTLARE
jgi:hypothetical protein